MMAKVFSLLFVLALCFGAAGGKLEQVSAALPQGAAGGVELALSIGGTMCVWSGILEVMDQSGLTEKVSRLLSPVIRGIFGKAAQDKQARQALSQNMAANLLGLGSAATPAGLRAARRLAQTGGRPDHSAVLRLMVLNSASLQLIAINPVAWQPGTATRAAAGSAQPFAILPAVWLASLGSVCAALAVSALLERVWHS